MKKYKKPSWAVSQIVRETGLVEDVCECGVGHPNREFLMKNKDFHGMLDLNKPILSVWDKPKRKNKMKK